MRPKTKSALIKICFGSALFVALVGGGVVWRLAQISSDLDAIRGRGMAAFKQGDYVATLAELKLYLVKRKEDPEALYAYAKARSAVTESSGKNVVEGINAYRRYLSMRPSDEVARRELLDVYNQAGTQANVYNTETISTADELLAKNPKDTAAIRAKAMALFRYRRVEDALAPAMAFNELSPTDLEGQLLTLKVLVALERPVNELTDRTEALRKQYPKDPRFQTLQAISYLAVYDRNPSVATLEHARDLLVQAAKQDAPDVQFAKITCEFLERLGQFGTSADLLTRAAQKNNDPAMTLLLVQRLWQKGHYDQVVDALKDITPTSATSDTRLLAYKALAMCSQTKFDDAKPLVDALANRHDDGAAVAWSMGLRSKFYDKLETRAAIDQYLAALARDKDNIVIRYWTGEAYASLGENELALLHWGKITDAPSWAAPHVRMAQILSNTGRTANALKEADAAFNQSQSAVTAANRALTWFKRIQESGDTAELPKLLDFLANVQKTYPGEAQTLPVYAACLVSLNRPADAKAGRTLSDTDQAKQIINTALSPDTKLPEDTYIRLSGVSRAGKLGLETALLDRCEKVYGLTPRIALNRTVGIYASGKPKEALQYISKTAEEKGHTMEWDMAVAQYLEVVRDPGAKDAWIKLADANEKELVIQNAALDARSTWADRDFIQRTIKRVRDLTGDEGMSWRLARANWLLGSGNKERDSADAVVTLTEIVNSSPRLARPRLMLAEALENSGRSSESLDQLKQAAVLQPNDPEIGMLLVQKLQSVGKYDDARDELNHIASLPLNTEQETRIAAAFAMQGLSSQGVDLLENKAHATDDVTRDAILAELYRRRGQHERADAIYQKLLAGSVLKPSIIVSAADFYALRGDMARAETILARLSEIKTEPGQRETILGTFYELYISKEKGLEQYIAATKAAPADEKTWVQLLGFYLRNRRYDDLLTTSADAAKALPGSAAVETMRRAGDVFKANASRSDLPLLAKTIARDPNDPAVRDTLDLIEEIRRAGLTPDRIAGRARQLSDRYVQFLPLHLMLIEAYADSNRISDACSAAARTVENFPSAPEAANVAVNVYAAANRNEEMLQAAKKWRDRALEHTLPADLAIAEANMRLNNPDGALDILHSHLDAAQAKPDENVKVITAYCAALTRAGKSDEASHIMLPLAQKNDAWRAQYLSIHGQTNFASAKKWLQNVAPSIGTSPDAQVALAEAWLVAGSAFGEKEAFEQTRDILKPLSARADARANAVMMYAIASEQLGDIPSAEAAYRAALKIDANLAPAQNNLACLLLNNGGDLTEARDLASKATAPATAPATYFDTLARVLLKSNDRRGALAAFDAALQRDSKAIEALIGKAHMLAQDGKGDKASAVLQQIESLLPSNANLPPALKAELEAVRTAIKTSASNG